MGRNDQGGNDQGGNVLGAKRLGEEMVWGRNVPDSREPGFKNDFKKNFKFKLKFNKILKFKFKFLPNIISNYFYFDS